MGMSIEKATEPSAAEMLSTMEVRVRMLPCSGESAALSRSASQRQKKKTTIKKHWLHFQLKLPCHSDERMGVKHALTLAAVALRALLRGAAPLGAAAAGAAGAGLAG